MTLNILLRYHSFTHNNNTINTVKASWTRNPCCVTNVLYNGAEELITSLLAHIISPQPPQEDLGRVLKWLRVFTERTSLFVSSTPPQARRQLALMVGNHFPDHLLSKYISTLSLSSPICINTSPHVVRSPH